MSNNVDWSDEQQMDNYTFTAKSVVVRLIPRFKIWRTGFFGRNAFKKEFMLKNGIKKNSRPSSAIMPKYYMVNSSRNDYIAAIRDSIITSKYSEYDEIRKTLENAEKEIKYDLGVAEKNLNTQRTVLEEQKNKLTTAKRTKNSMNIVSYQAAIESQITHIKASEQRVDIMRENYNALCAQAKKNRQQWQKQIGLIEGTINNLIINFEKNITKKVRDDYDFGRFEMNIRNYSAPVQSILDGEK